MATKVAPLLQRPVDLFFVVIFAVFAVIALLIDLGQSLAPHDVGIPRDYFSDLPWPPAFVHEPFNWWCDVADPLLRANPLWFRAMAWFSPLVDVPFYLAAMYAFTFGRNWIRTPAIMYSTALTSFMVIIMIEQAWGQHASHNQLLIWSAYGPYASIPVLLWFRVLRHDVFGVEGSRSAAKKGK